MDDFEAFRQRKMAAKKAKERQAADPEAEARLGWVDGMGPKGPTNPKVKGFILGRYKRKKIDPSTLQRPKGYEKTQLADHEETSQDELEDRKGPEVKGFQKY